VKIRLYIYNIALALSIGIVLARSSVFNISPVAQAQESDCATITEIPNNECQALAEIYQSTAGENWVDNRGWFVTATPCSWYGVICDTTLDTQSHVVRLELTQNNLNGSIPTNLAELSYLQDLELSYNQLSGSIPPTLGSLNRLIWLSLHSNQLSGEIPPELSNLTELQLLSLSINQLSGAIPPALGNLSKLTKLYLFENQLDGLIPQNLGDLSLLQALDISTNQLTSAIPATLGNLSALEELVLSNNKLTGQIPLELTHLAQLRLLSIATNQLSGPIPAGIENLTALQEIYLSKNQLEGPIPGQLSSLSQLEYVELGINQLSGTIPAVLGNLTLLQQLDLSDNQLSGEIPATLGNLTALEGLYLNDNQLSGLKLTVFSANGNQLSGPIPSQLGNLSDLFALGLAGNQFDGAIPATLGNLSKLEQLMLSSNQLTGDIPAALATLPLLNQILVKYNSLSANDPALQNFLDGKDVDWSQTQTIVPTELSSNFAANPATGTYDLHLAWQPIPYVEDGGYYEVDYGAMPAGPYTLGGKTVDKRSNAIKLEGLSPSTEYNVRVRAYTPAHGSQQNDLWSDYAIHSVQTPPPIQLDCELDIIQTGENCLDLDDENKEVTLTEGEYITIKLPVIPSTGSFWYIVNEGAGEDSVGTPILRSQDRPTFNMPDLPYPLVGQTETEIYRFDPVAAGTSTIHLERRDVRGNVVDTYTVTINAEGTFENVQPPSTPLQDVNTSPLHPPELPNGRVTAATVRSERAIKSLPVSYSLCDHPDGNNYCPPIQYQGTCGSCWAFTTVGAMETLIKYKDGVDRDLSEQALLSCNSESAGVDSETGQEKFWSCENGGWYAFDYYTDKKTDPHQSGPGTVWELDFIYTGADLACKPGLEHRERLTSWSYIYPDDPHSMVYVEDIKQAVHEYGPVVTSLCVGPETNAYQGGIFSTDESYVCDQYGVETNHAVVIVGWDDSESVWIVRNSWDTWWGEEGYMRIKYGTSNIGFASAYALYEGSDVIGPNAPSDLSVESQIAPEGYQMLLSWADNSDDETGFQLFREKDGNWQVEETLPADINTFIHTGLECNQNYNYRLTAINDEGPSGYSNMVKISAECEDLKAPINVTATTSDTGIRLEWENTNVLQDSVLILRWNWDTEAWDELVTVDRDTQRFEDRTDLNPGQTYGYAIQAKIGERFSQPAGPVKATSPVIEIDGPTKARAEVVEDGSVRLSWQDNSNNEDGYLIMRYNPDNNSWEEVQTLDIDVTEHVDVILDCGGQEFHYQVLAYKGAV